MMWQTTWYTKLILNKFKEIKKNKNKWYNQPNTSRRSEIINTRTIIGHINLPHIQ